MVDYIRLHNFPSSPTNLVLLVFLCNLLDNIKNENFTKAKQSAEKRDSHFNVRQSVSVKVN